MLAAVSETHPTFPPRKKFTRGDCAVLEQAGQLDSQRFELIEGDLIEKMSKNWPHMYALAVLQTWFLGVFGSMRAMPEGALNLFQEDNPTSEPEPDLMVLRRPMNEFKAPRFTPEDLHLVVEISDSTLRFDTTVKAGLSARAGIVEYWVLDINRRCLGVHRDPAGGEYRSVTWYGENESIAPLAAIESAFSVSSAFPTAAVS